MSESNNEYEKENSKLEIVLFIILFIFLAAVAFVIAIAVKSNEWKDPITIDNWLIYYGTISGSLIGGFITATGLYFTLRQNSKTILEQRKFDQDAINKQNEQFYKDYNLRLINQKLDTYKEIYLLIEQIINKAIAINHKIVAGEPLADKSHAKDVEEFCEIHNKFIYMVIFETEQNLIDLSNGASKESNKVVEMMNKCLEGKVSNVEYCDYFVNIVEMYTKVSNELKNISKDIYRKKIFKDTKIQY